MSEYLDANLLRHCVLEELQPGELYIPVDNRAERFLGGRANDTRVLITIEGEHPFDVAEPHEWSRPDGFGCKEIRFEVEVGSAIAAQYSPELNGAIVLTNDGPSIISIFGGRRLLISMRPGTNPTRLDPRAVAFRRWRIVAGPQEQQVELFAHKPKQGAATVDLGGV